MTILLDDPDTLFAVALAVVAIIVGVGKALAFGRLTGTLRCQPH